MWQTSALFPAFFLRAQPLVRAACPDCLIALAGISNQYDSSSSNYQLFEGYLAAITAGAHIGRAFDVFDFHYYKASPSSEEIASAATAYRGLLQRYGMGEVPLWSTETGLYSGDPDGPQFGARTEDEQARDLAKLVAWLARSGVQRIYYWTLVEQTESTGADGFFDDMGLVYNGVGRETAQRISGGTAKKAYVTYGLLSQALQGFVGASELAPGIERLETSSGPVFVVWSEGGATHATLTGLSAATAKVQALIPDAQGQTSSTTAEVANGSVSIDVDANPRLVTLSP